MPRRITLTTRATLLGLVICALVLTLAYPARLYLKQQAQLAELSRSNAQAQQRVDDLRRTVGRYDDPAWVEDEARRRLHYARPGERSYVTPATPTASATPGAAGPRVGPDAPWYSRLWSQAAGTDAPAVPAPAPRR
jgi:cell division protein FtsB